MASITIQNVSVTFGLGSSDALKAADIGLSRSEIKTKTGIMLAVHDCSLNIEDGQIFVLMGLSGSGKSTLLRTVNGLVVPLRGSVKLDHEGQTFYVNTLRSRKLRYLRTNLVSMVFQQFALLPWRTVADNVGLGLEIIGTRRARLRSIILEQLELVGLAQWADRPVSELSGGMQQRVGLARALATGAPVLLMDEPFSALDPLIRKHLQGELQELQRRLKKTVFFISHDLDEAIRIGDNIAIIKDGRIIQSGTPKEIVLSPVNSHVAEFVSYVNPLTFLTAADIMRPYSYETAQNSFSARAEPGTLLSDIIQTINCIPGNIGVIDNGIPVGIIFIEDIITHLAARGKC